MTLSNTETRQDKSSKDLKDAIDAHSDELRHLSLEIHGRPELGYQEVFAHGLLTDYLEKKGFKVTRGAFDLPTAFVAEYESPAASIAAADGQKIKTIGLCSEYDALPGVGHACGHNLIAIAGVAAALGIKAALEKNNLAGRIRLLGTPAEETTGGKLPMIERGAFDGLEACVMTHPAPFDVVYSTMLSVGGCLVEFHGKASHASASPWEGINALDAMVMVYNGLGLLRQQTAPTSRVHCIVVNGGQAANIIPEYASGKIMYRATSVKDHETLYNNIVRLVNSAAEATGCTVTITKEMEYQPVPHNNLLAARYAAYTEELGVKYLPRAEQEARPSGSTDMGNVCHVVPGIHPMYNLNSMDGETDGTVSNHSHKFTEKAKTEAAHLTTLRSAKGLALTGLDVLIEPGFTEAVWEDFGKNVPKGVTLQDVKMARAALSAGGCGCH